MTRPSAGGSDTRSVQQRRLPGAGAARGQHGCAESGARPPSGRPRPRAAKACTSAPTPPRSTRSGSTTRSRRTAAPMWTRRGCPSGTDQLGAEPVVDLHTFLPGEVTHPLTPTFSTRAAASVETCRSPIPVWPMTLPPLGASGTRQPDAETQEFWPDQKHTNSGQTARIRVDAQRRCCPARRAAGRAASERARRSARAGSRCSSARLHAAGQLAGDSDGGDGQWPGAVFVERGARVTPLPAAGLDAESISRAAVQIARPLSKDPIAEPIIDARLADGSRVAICGPPTAPCAAITIRRFGGRAFTIDELTAGGSLPGLVVEAAGGRAPEWSQRAALGRYRLGAQPCTPAPDGGGS